LLNTLKEQKACHQAAFAYYKKMAETQTSFDPVMTEEWVYHALGYGDEKTASRQGARLLKYLREHLDYSNSRRVGQWILAGKKQDLADGNDAFLLNELATTLKYLGEYHEAVTYYEKALALDRKVYGNLHLHVARDLNNLGSTWRALGEPGKTLDYCRQALHILRTGSIENEHPHLTAIVLENLGTAWGGKGDFDRATDYFQQALVILRTLHGDFDPDVATALNNLGSALKNKGDSREAAGYFNQALTIDRTAYGSTHPDVATDLNNLGSAAYDLGEYANARDYYEEALILWRKIYPQGHRNIGITLFNLGEAYLALKQKAKARACFQEAHTILKKALGPEHPAVKTVAESLANAGSEESLP
jgi:tetratricopeptide (TPR) repeat protein